MNGMCGVLKKRQDNAQIAIHGYIISEAQKVCGIALNPEEIASSRKVKNPLIENKNWMIGCA